MEQRKGKVVAIGVPAAEAAAAPPQLGPSIAVLPFSNLGDDPAQRYLSDGITEDIITELSRFREISVTSRGSSFSCEDFSGDVKRVARELGVRYVLMGGVRRAENRLRLTVRLLDGISGEQIWADRFDGTLDDVLTLQEQVARRIVGSIAPELHFAEQRRAERMPDGARWGSSARARATISPRRTPQRSACASSTARTMPPMRFWDTSPCGACGTTRRSQTCARRTGSTRATSPRSGGSPGRNRISALRRTRGATPSRRSP